MSSIVPQFEFERRISTHVVKREARVAHEPHDQRSGVTSPEGSDEESCTVYLWQVKMAGEADGVAALQVGLGKREPSFLG